MLISRVMRPSIPLVVVAALSCALLPACTEADDPLAAGTSKSIGPDGGFIEAGALRITFPPGALGASTEFTITPTGDGPPALGAAYRVTPQVTLGQRATLEYTFTAAEVEGRDPRRLVIVRDIGSSYAPLPLEGIDFDAQVVTCTDDAMAAHYGLVLSSNAPGDTDTDTDTDSDTDATDTTPSTTTDASDTEAATDAGTEGTTTQGGDTTTTGGESSSSTGEGTTGPGECGDGSVNPGEVCFIEGLSFDAPAGPRAVLATDLDGDGHADLIVAGGTDDAVGVRLGNGTGILIADATYPVGNDPSSLRLVDLDGDGVDDLVVTLAGDQTVGVLLGAAEGTFGDVTPYDAGGNGPLAIGIGDINEDTFLDVAIAKTSANIAFLPGDGTGALGAATAIVIGGASPNVHVGDFSGDDNLDVVSIVGSDLVLVSGNGAGLFGAPATTAIGAPTTAFAVADLNGDGNDDAAVASEGLVTIALGNGVGGFGGGVPFAVGAGTVAITAADINADGELDLITVDATDETVTVLVGNGLGAFDDTFVFSTGTNPSAVAVADFNDDGVGDIAVTNRDDDDTTILLSSP